VRRVWQASGLKPHLVKTFNRDSPYRLRSDTLRTATVSLY
jgi:hypothetical protein